MCKLETKVRRGRLADRPPSTVCRHLTGEVCLEFRGYLLA